MATFDDLSTSIATMRERIDQLRRRLDLANDQREFEDLERRSSDPGYWDNPDEAQLGMRRMGELRARLDTWRDLEKSSADLGDLLEMAVGDPEMMGEIEQERDALLAKLDTLELESALNGPHDRSNAILVVHSGEGGIDAQDWASMLARMYLRWGERKGFKVEMLDSTDGEEAGVKNATIELKGANAYGLLKGEGGSHRLVRLSPFDSAHRRHTAFALVEVLPEIESDNEIDLNPDDVRVDTYRASGAGGQHVNKTSSAVRLTHLPTGIVVTCQNERSQLQNRESAFKILRSRLLEMKLKAEAEELSKIKGDMRAAGFGNRSRSYVLQPYTQVTDHRTEMSVGDAQGVLDGNLDPFIDAYLQAQITPDAQEAASA
ncbi:MAG: peptide chain release factor 2 [Thermomicrobiales bacterium]